MTNEQRSSRAPAPAAGPPARPQASLDTAPPGAPAVPAPPKPATVVDLVAHVESPNGIAMDLAIRNVVWEQLPGVTVRALKFEEQLLKDGFKPLAPPVINVPVAAAGAAARSTTYTGSEITECPECGGQVYDNRTKKASGEMKSNAPWFACKDQECGWKKWPDRPGGGNRRRS